MLLFAVVPCAYAQDILIYGMVKGLPDKLPIENTDITILDEAGVPVDATTSLDSGRYQFGLSLGTIYRIKYAAHRAIPKTLVIDLHNMDASPADIEGGWGMNIDVTLYPEMEDVPDSLIAIPFGVSSWSAADTMFQWDMPHTQRVRDAWAPWIERIGEARIPHPDRERDVRSPMLLVLALLILAWQVYLGDRFDAWTAASPHKRISPMIFIMPIIVLGVFGWMGFDEDGWLGWCAVVSAAIAGALFYMLISRWKYFFGRRDKADEAVDYRTKASRVLNIMRYAGGIPTVLCAAGLWASLDHTLHPEEYFLRHALVGLVTVGLVCLLFAGAIKRTFVVREDRVIFWFLSILFAFILVPGVIHFVDKELAKPDHSHQVEITGLYESRGRRGKVKHTAQILVDGRSKELPLLQEVWESASDLDAMDLRIGQGPFGIDHIIEWYLVPRSRQVVGDTATVE